MFGYSREAVRVKVKKCDGNLPVELRKFSVDPEITSFEVLQSILAKAFDLKNDFTICFRIYDINGYETYMPILSDWDLDAAFLKAHNVSVATNTEPCLSLRVDLKLEESSDDWDIKQNVNIITQIRTANTSQEAKPSPRLHGIINQVGKTLNLVQRAFNFGEDGNTVVHPPRPPLSDSEFRKFLDPIGQIVYAKELRSVIYFGGIEPSLRKVVWKHLLNVYPDGMSGKERMDYIKKKAAEYINLREMWKNAIGQGGQIGELAYTTGMVRKDVLRTDRHHPFYAGSDDNQNIASLFNILTTYALNHPKVSYCQGMSDLASPLLVTMNDEAHAYICFCALMQRLSSNFMIDGIAMTQKFTHLAEGILYYDPEFYNYLKLHQADDLLFCYRWLLLEMKREFAFEDSLRMLEVLWSSLPADPPIKELKLFDKIFQPIPNSPPPPPIKTPRENAYTKIIELRRQNSSISLNKKTNSSSIIHRQNHSLDESITINNKSKFIVGKYQSFDDGALRSINFNSIDERKIIDLSSSMTNLIKSNSNLRNKNGGHFKDLKEKLFSSLEKLDGDNGIKEEEDNGKKTYQARLVKNLNEFQSLKNNTKTLEEEEEEKDEKKPTINLTKSKNSQNLSSPSSQSSSEEYSPLMTSITQELRLELENLDRTIFNDKKPKKNESPIKTNSGIFIWENPLHHLSKNEEKEEEKTPDEQSELEYDEHMMNSCEEIKEDLMKKSFLPSPNEFGGGNPFLMFLCITVLLQHRDDIIGKSMDYNETAMYFDKMVRKHNVCRVLNQARQMYARYMKQQTINAVSYQKKTNNQDC